MHLERTLELAKRGKYTRAELYAGMQALAEQMVEPGQSVAQAFNKLINTPEGRELLVLQKDLPGKDIDPAWQAPISKAQPTVGDTHVASTFDGLVRGLMRSEECSYNTAVNLAMASPGGRHLFKMVKREQQVASGLFTKADMAMLDAIDDEEQERADMHTRTPSDFEREVDKLMAAKPHLSRGAAIDHVQKTKPDLWESFKVMKLGGGTLPQARSQREQAGDEDVEEAETMRTPPPRASQWDSPNAGSRYAPPTGEPRRAGDIRPGPDDAPALKRWVNLKKKLMAETGWDEERAVMVLKCLPEGRRAIAAVIKAAEAAATGS